MRDKPTKKQVSVYIGICLIAMAIAGGFLNHFKLVDDELRKDFNVNNKAEIDRINNINLLFYSNLQQKNDLEEFQEKNFTNKLTLAFTTGSISSEEFDRRWQKYHEVKLNRALMETEILINQMDALPDPPEYATEKTLTTKIQFSKIVIVISGIFGLILFLVYLSLRAKR